MKKISITLFFIYSFSFLVKGVSNDTNKIDKNNRFVIGISLGAAIPSNNFGTPSAPSPAQYDSTFSGYAKAGFHFNINAKIYLLSNFGFMGSIGGTINSFNTSTYNSSIFYSETRTTSTQASIYYIGEYMIGPFVTIPMLNNFSFQGSIIGGLITSSFPTITTTFSASSTQSAGQSNLTANNSNTFGINFSMGFEKKISRHFITSLDISYSYTQLQYSSIVFTQTLQNSNSLAVQIPSREISLGLFKPTIGVGYCF